MMRPWSSSEKRESWADLPAGRQVARRKVTVRDIFSTYAPDPRKGGDCLLKRPEVAKRVTSYVKSQLGLAQGWSISVKNPWVICLKSDNANG